VVLDSQRGLGTTVRIRIPLTLAIISALMVTAGGDRYAIPQPNVIELLQLDDLERKKQIDKIQTVTMCRLRGHLVPLVFLDSELRLDSRSVTTDSTVKAPEADSGTVVVLRTHGRQFGLVVDEVNDIQEIVVKPLSKLIQAASLFAGATIIGDGRVSLILDVHGLALRSSVVSDSGSRDDEKPSDILAPHREILLVFEGANSERFAVPLRQVTRLEEFPSSAIEETGGREVTQYGDEILPLIQIPELLPWGRLRREAETQQKTNEETIKVVVFRKESSAVGLVVESIVDVVEHDISKDQCVIQGRVTKILDLGKIFQRPLLPAGQAVELEV
jgi:two-component system, chemotaxis family, sensor kinase CheA